MVLFTVRIVSGKIASLVDQGVMVARLWRAVLGL